MTNPLVVISGIDSLAGTAPEPDDRARLQADDTSDSIKKYDGGVGREQHGYPPLNRSLEHLIKEIERL